MTFASSKDNAKPLAFLKSNVKAEKHAKVEYVLPDAQEMKTVLDKMYATEEIVEILARSERLVVPTLCALPKTKEKFATVQMVLLEFQQLPKVV